MNTNTALRVTAVGLTLALLSPARAGPQRPWPQDELRRKADLIAIGTARSTRDIGGGDSRRWESVPVVTCFDVQAVLKGHAGRSLSLHHARISKRFARGLAVNKDGTRTIVIDPPDFVTFDPRRKVQYLMYLKRRADGAYEPVTGQYAPHYSFFRLMAFFPTAGGP